MNLLRGLTGPKKRENTGALTGRIISLPPYTVKVEALIGEGGFATIYRAIDVPSQTAFALKHFMLSGDPEAERDVHTEVAIMNALVDCRDTLSLRAHAMGTTEAVLLMDLCQGSLASHVISRSTAGAAGTAAGPARLSMSEIQDAFGAVARAVSAMHSLNPPLAHRDVKAENVLRRGDGRWVLCDFGSATTDQKVYSTPAEISREEERIRKQTTPAYRAPELWDLWTREHIGLAVDVWSLGCLLYFLAYNRLPFDGDAKLQILNGTYTLPPGRPASLENLIRDMLKVEAKERISAHSAAERVMQLDDDERWGGDVVGMPQKELTGAPPSTAPAPAAAHQPPASQVPEHEFAEWTAEFSTSVAAQRPVNSRSNSGAKQGMDDGWATFSQQGGSGRSTSHSGAPTESILPESRAESRNGHESKTSAIHSSTVDDHFISTSSSALEAQAPIEQAVQGLSVAETSSQLQEHCQVLEQLLEERNKEVATLRAEVQRQAAEASTSAEHMQGQISSLKCQLEQAKEDALHWKAKAAAPATASASAAAASSLKSLVTRDGGSQPGSRPGSSLSDRPHVSSFPLSLGAEQEQGAGMGHVRGGGAPMRGTASRIGGRSASSSPTKRGPASTIKTIGQPTLFEDLDPLG